MIWDLVTLPYLCKFQDFFKNHKIGIINAHSVRINVCEHALYKQAVYKLLLFLGGAVDEAGKINWDQLVYKCQHN